MAAEAWAPTGPSTSAGAEVVWRAQANVNCGIDKEDGMRAALPCDQNVEIGGVRGDRVDVLVVERPVRRSGGERRDDFDVLVVRSMQNVAFPRG